VAGSVNAALPFALSARLPAGPTRVWLHLTERHKHEHDFQWAGDEPHAHGHRHAALAHKHPHFPGIHHRHSHRAPPAPRSRVF
jgi:hypothetical protein